MGAATFETISRWLQEGQEKNPAATHMLVVCDTFTHDDYPVYVLGTENIDDVIKNHSTTIQRVLEVYSYAMPLLPQLQSARAWNL